MLLRRASAAAQSSALKPKLALEPPIFALVVVFATGFPFRDDFGMLWSV